MSSISSPISSISSISAVINQQVSHAVYHLPAGTYSLPDDAGKLAQELLINLGLIARSSPPPTNLALPPPPAPASAPAPAPAPAAAPASGRTRTVSKKMKDAFLASPDRTEEDLKRVSKAYKDASDADIAAAGGDFVSFANHVLLAAPAPAPAPAPATPPAKKDAKKDAKKVKPRLAWSAAEKKVFKDIVADVTDDAKAEFAAYIASKSDEDFAAFAMAGHMRAWFDAKSAATAEPKAGNGEFTPAEYDLARSMQTLSVKDDGVEDDEENLEDIEIDGEQFRIGTKSGDIFVPLDDDTEAKVGRAGEGKFKDVRKP